MIGCLVSAKGGKRLLGGLPREALTGSFIDLFSNFLNVIWDAEYVVA